ncbi:hypothetical protein MVES1_003653 [Malassezia vespertilionis]|uniref:uncharacterized protein n=1 Tax=Malassezia vespertilionis TaxID=2020962 RepID=UPI0024B091FA|nr:uncharacterized protein MVES1_003653 [Malassezia vespertilionis]WFD08281.1 hypothetical protein MVES1_003653 [Malassezia vespertilionis]
MVRGRNAARLRAVVDRLESGAGTRKLPASIAALEFRVPTKFAERRTWELMRSELPRIVYANPALKVDVVPLGGAEKMSESADANSAAGASVSVVYHNMPRRTIVLGEKSAGDIAKELMTVAQFHS